MGRWLLVVAAVINQTHLLTDLLAYIVAAITLKLCLSAFPVSRSPLPEGYGLFYAVVASIGAAVGSVLLGTANTWLAGMEMTLAKSVLGALIGGVLAIELMKWLYNVRGSTGPLLVPGIALGIAIGRVGCHLAGLDDYTYGVPTESLFGVDLGDGVLRHPVALYEAGALALFFGIYLWLLAVHRPAIVRWGFYLFCGFYGLQRFGWEQLKPYPDLALGLNVFQFGCLFLLLYAALMVVLDLRSSVESAYEPV